MTNVILSLFLLAVSFYLLGKSADLVVLNIREIGERLGIKMIFLGVILGFLTSLPELFLGVNAIISDVPDISFGNLLGGIVVLFGLILGISLVLNRQIKTNGEETDYAIVAMYVFFPLLMGLDGKLGPIDGIIIVAVYMLILYIFYMRQRNNNVFKLEIIRKNDIVKKCILILLGLVMLLIISSGIIKISIALLEGLNISFFLVGLLLFSIGTNLPEIIVAARSCKKNMQELSVSNLAGSAMANVMIIGIFSFISPIYPKINFSYYSLIFFIALLFVSFLYFYKTDKLLSRNEGYVLIFIYILFLIMQISFYG